MKILMIALLISGLFACASNDPSTKGLSKKEKCELLDSPARESCLTDIERRQEERERDRQKNKVMCNSRLTC